MTIDENGNVDIGEGELVHIEQLVYGYKSHKREFNHVRSMVASMCLQKTITSSLNYDQAAREAIKYADALIKLL
jgi:hypothetical protein